MSVKQTEGLQRIPAMPEELFSSWNAFVGTYSRLEAVLEVNRLDDSLVRTWNVNNVPLKPSPQSTERYRDALVKQTDSLANLFPEKLIDINIGENEGLVKICRELLKEHKEKCQINQQERYLVLNVDCNIFDRILKVLPHCTSLLCCLLLFSSKCYLCALDQICYDTSHGGKEFRELVSVNLAYWHTYKYAAMKLWKTFLMDFFAPLFHCLYPGHQCFTKPSSFPLVLSQMQYLRLAYPLLAEEVEALLQSDRLRPSMRTALLDFRFLCSFAIPVVCSVSLRLSLSVVN